MKLQDIDICECIFVESVCGEEIVFMFDVPCKLHHGDSFPCSIVKCENSGMHSADKLVVYGGTETSRKDINGVPHIVTDEWSDEYSFTISLLYNNKEVTFTVDYPLAFTETLV